MVCSVLRGPAGALYPPSIRPGRAFAPTLPAPCRVPLRSPGLGSLEYPVAPNEALLKGGWPYSPDYRQTAF